MGVARNTIWNLFGYLAPTVVALVALPPTVRLLGVERYGILALILVVHDYFNYFDFGLGRATTHFLSAALQSRGARDDSGAVFWTCMVFHVALGVVVGLLFWLLLPLIGRLLLGDSPSLLAEGSATLKVAALLPPVLLFMLAGRGALEAAHRFDLVNVVKVPLNSLTFVVPLLGALAGAGLPGIILVFVAVRLVAGMAYLFFCLRVIPSTRSFRLDLSLRRKLLSFGGLVMGSNVIGLVLVDGERFLIAAIASVGALTYYAIPNDAITRLWILPASLASVLFPLFSTAEPADPRSGRLYADGTLYLLIALVPVVVIMQGYAGPLLTFWMGLSFAGEAVLVLQIVTLGVMLDSLARIPLCYLQARGHPGVPVRIRMWELPAYLAASAICTLKWGIVGAAWVWTGRIALETLLLFSVTSALRLIVIPTDALARLKRGIVASAFALAGGTMAMVGGPLPPAWRLAWMLAVLAAYGWYAWQVLVDPAHRAALLSRTFMVRQY